MAVTHITHTFDYDIPDKYLYQTNELGLTASWTYRGPRRIWVHVDRETNKLLPQDSCSEDDGTPEVAERARIHAGLGNYAVLVDVTVDPIIASAIYMDIDQADFPQVEFTREDIDPTDTTVYYSRAATPTLDHTYEIGDITWNPETELWTYPLPWKQPHMTEEALQVGKTNVIADAKATKTDLEANNQDGSYTDMITKIGEFVTELEAIDDKFPRDTWDPWMIPFPEDPRVNSEDTPDHGPDEGAE